MGEAPLGPALLRFGLAACLLGRSGCIACDSPRAVGLCDGCAEALRPAEGCPRCGSYDCETARRPLTAPVVATVAEPLSARAAPPAPAACDGLWLPYESVAAVLSYAGPARRIVRELKSRRCAVTLAIAARLMAPAVPAWVEAVTWVPAGPLRSRRGFDQGEELARALGRLIGLRPKGLIARSHPHDQRELDEADRWLAAEESFCAGPRVAGRRLLLIDDVTTTGASLYWASCALREAGALRIAALALCRTPRRDAARQNGERTRFRGRNHVK